MSAWQWSTVWTAVGALATVAATGAVIAYAWLTRGLLLEAREQTRAASAPILTFTLANAKYLVSNIGQGPAVNVCVTREDGAFTGVPSLGSIRAGADISLLTNSGLTQSMTHPYFLYYQDLWGVWHRTKFIASNSQPAPQRPLSCSDPA